MGIVPGTNLGPYRVIEPLGRGGMAAVYKAYEPALDRYVALKVLPAEFLHDPTFAERFKREAKVIARLEHPNIIPIYAFDITDGIPWMAMRLIAGGALSNLLKAQRIAAPRAVAILKGAAQALDYAHAKGVVHRDVKPQNILLDEGERVYLADFGIAKIVESASGLTATGMISGTPQYMAPEQATAAHVDHRADIYALGIVAYEMFTGRVPFAADTPVAVLMKHVSEPMPLPAPGEMPETMVRPILKATAKTADDRWPSALAFVESLDLGLAMAASRSAGVPDVADGTRDLRAVSTARLPGTAQAAEALDPWARPLSPPPPPTLGAAARTVPSGMPQAREQTQRAAAVPTRVARPVRARSKAAVGVFAGAAVALLATGGLAVYLLTSRGTEPAPSPQVPVASTPSITPTAIPGATTPSQAAVTPQPTVAPAQPRPPEPQPSGANAAPAARPPVTAPNRAGSPAPVPMPTRPASAPTPGPTLAPPPPTAAEEPIPRAPAPEPAIVAEVRELTQAVADGRDTRSRWQAAEALGNLGPEARPAVPTLVTALRDRSPEVRMRAAEALGKIGPDAASAVADLVTLLRDADVVVRTEGAKALGLIGPAARDGVAGLASILRDKDVGVKRESARALARIGADAAPAVPALIEAVRDKDKVVLRESAKALGKIGPPAKDAVPALTAALKNDDLLVVREVTQAIRAITGSEPSTR